MDERLRRRIGIIALTLLLLGAAFGAWKLARRAPDDAALMRGNGRLEAVQIDVAARLPGRVDALLVDEGQSVRAGQPLLRLDAAPLRAQLAEAHAQSTRNRDAVVTAAAQLRLREQQLAAAVAGVAQRDAERAAAEQRLARSQALLPLGGVSAQQLDDERAQVAGARSALDAARAQVEAARAAVAAAGSQEVEAQSVVRAGEAAEHRIQLDIDDCTVRAPVDGRVEYVVARPGEVQAAGATLLGLVDTARLDFVFFLAEQDAGHVALGDPARLVLDALPRQALAATVTYVSAVAQFTPKTVETQDERQKLMFRVKARVDPATAAALIQLKNGMPGMAYLRRARDAAWPARLGASGAP